MLLDFSQKPRLPRKTVDAGKLTSNLSVKIQGQLSNSNQLAMNAQVIEIK